MPVERTCTFCGEQIEPGTGKMYIRRDGTIHYFCSSKCQKNQLKLGRLGRTTRWTRRYVRALRRAGPRAAPEEEAAEAPPEEAPEAVPEPVPEEPAREAPPEEAVPAAEAEEAPPTGREAILEAFAQIPGVGPATAEALWEAGFTSLDALRDAATGDLTEVKGIGPATAERIRDHLGGGS